MKLLYFCGLIIFVMIFAPFLKAEETIEWIRSDFPPVYILDGKYKDQGSSDLIQKFLIDSLPNYRHVQSTANFARIMEEIRNKENVCCAALLKTPEREKFTEFSVAQCVLLTNRLIIKRQDISQLRLYITKDQTVNLNSLLQTGTFTLGVAKGRRYGKNIGQILKKYYGSNTVYERAGEDQLKGLIKMLLSGTRDISGILGYTNEVHYNSKQLAIDANQLKSYPIEGSPPYILGYIGCSKSDFGKIVISQINRIVEEARMNQIAEFYEKWLDQEVSTKYRGFVKEAFTED
jgi:uncharacterized protein (TIGR02285 family)